MSILKRTKRPSGFTLVELLIVVIILAILAAIVIPQFSNSTDDAKTSALQSNLSAIRNAIELYRAQHGAYPGTAPTGTAPTGCSAGATATDATLGVRFQNHMTKYSDANGHTCDTVTADYKYGPYIRDKIPAEPFSGKADVAAPPATPSETAPGWAYTVATGKFTAASSKYSTQ